jgi:hypothetical protein
MDKCSQCGFLFKETSVQFYRRLKNNWPKVCRDCYRISTAEQKAAVRESKAVESKLDNDIKKFIEDWVSEYGSINPTTLMRKFKLNYNEALRLSER